MPRRRVYRRKRRSYGARRSYKRRYRRRMARSRTMVSRKQLWPTSAASSVVYAVERDFTMGLGETVNWQTWRLNSAFDPEQAVASDRGPLGLPQWAGLYTRYCVYKAQVTVDAFIPLASEDATDGDDYQGYMFMVARGGNSSSPLSVTGGADSICRYPDTTYRPLVSRDGKGHVRISRMFSIRQLEGKKIYPEDDYCADFTPTSGNNPNIIPAVDIGWATLQPNAVTAASIPFVIRIRYWCRFFNRAVATTDSIAS